MTTKNKPTNEFLYGIHPVIETLKAKRRKIFSIYTTKPTPKAWNVIEPLAKARGVEVQFVTREALNNITGSNEHQGILAWVGPFPFRNKPFDSEKQKLLLMLDGIQDARNLGAMLRSAYCTNVDGVIITTKGSAPLNAAAIKASAGLAEHLEIMLAPSAIAAAQTLKSARFTIYLASFKGERANTYTFVSPLCLVIGSEGEGISSSLYAVGTQVTLPQRTPTISYNASVAAGILLFTIAAQQGRI